MISTIRVEMFGGLSVWADGVPILDGSAKVNKPWQVFCYLVLNRGTACAPAKLLEVLWADDALTDPNNVLKNTVYALRREFKAAKNTHESPILFENGGYMCNNAIKFEVDIEIFEKIYQQALQTKGEEKIDMLRQAASLYKGELLPQLGEEAWVVAQSVYYKKKFTECINELCELLYEVGRYSELLAEATAANQIEPLEEDFYLYIFRALYALKMHRVIIPTYHKTARIFAEELGVQPNTEIHEIYAAASEKINQIEQDIMIIKEDLREVTHDNKPVNGPLYCTYDVFKYLYQMVARASERTGSRILIVLLTLQQTDGTPPPAKSLSAAMGHVKTLIIGGLLRKSDTVARYSKSQYIIMLSTEHANGADAVMNRIRRRCDAFLQPKEIKMVFATTELDPLGG